MPDEQDSCGTDCGCHTDVFSTERECPNCGKRLRLSGNAQKFDFRLACTACGYQSPKLSQAEVAEIL